MPVAGAAPATSWLACGNIFFTVAEAPNVKSSSLDATIAIISVSFEWTVRSLSSPLYLLLTSATV